MFLWAFLNKIVPKTAVIRVLHVFLLSVLIISTPMVGFGGCAWKTTNFPNNDSMIKKFKGDPNTVLQCWDDKAGLCKNNSQYANVLDTIVVLGEKFEVISAPVVCRCSYFGGWNNGKGSWNCRALPGCFGSNNNLKGSASNFLSPDSGKTHDLFAKEMIDPDGSKSFCYTRYCTGGVLVTDFNKKFNGVDGVCPNEWCIGYDKTKCSDTTLLEIGAGDCLKCKDTQPPKSEKQSPSETPQVPKQEIQTVSDPDPRSTECKQSGGTWEDEKCVCDADNLLKTLDDVCVFTNPDTTIMTRNGDKCIYTDDAKKCLVSGGNFGGGKCECDAKKGLVDDVAGKTCKCKDSYTPERTTVPGIDGEIIKQCNAPQNQQDCESEKAKKSGAEWDETKRMCMCTGKPEGAADRINESTHQWDGDQKKCVEKEEYKSCKAAAASGAVWSVAEDRCTCTGMRGNNKINENRYYWDDKSKICVPIVGYEECITKEAKKSGAEWNDTERECQCRKQNITNDETATPETYEWILANKKCEPRAGWLNCKDAIGNSSSMGQPKWDAKNFRCMCMESGYYWPTHETTECQQTDERKLCNSNEAKESGAVWNERIGKCECSASGSTWNHGRVKCECNNTDHEIQLVDGVYECVLTDAAKQRQNAESKIEQIAVKLNKVRDSLSVSVWKNKEGNFNTSRLISDGVAAVVLGTAGAVITSNIVKKNQVKYGFEDLKCHIGGQPVAGYGDAFRVRGR